MFPTQELYPGLLRCRQILYQLSYREDNEVLICYLHMRYRCMIVPKWIKQLYLIGFKVKCLYYINTHKCKENQPKWISGPWDLGNTQYWTDINIKASLRLVVWLTFLHNVNVKCADHCSISSSNCCFLTCIQVSQEADKVVWYSHLFKNFPQFIVIHTVKGFSID